MQDETADSGIAAFAGRLASIEELVKERDRTTDTETRRSMDDNIADRACLLMEDIVATIDQLPPDSLVQANAMILRTSKLVMDAMNDKIDLTVAQLEDLREQLERSPL